MGGGAVVKPQFDPYTNPALAPIPSLPGGGKPLPTPPNPNDPSTAADLNDQAQIQRNAKGRAATYLTQGQDISGNTSVFSRSLLAT